MAIYHFSAQVISRGKGQSAVAAAAYRSGDKLQDERTGEEKFYKRNIQPESMILAPSNSPEWVKDRERLWNEVEKAETRKNSQLSREINVALPIELSSELQKELICNFVQEQFVDKGMIADINIHRDDPNNPHAHIMLTTREISEENFTVKNRDWNNKELLNQWREEWSNHANKALEREGIQERISHLSHEARGLEQLPTVHLGHVVNEMEKRGVATERGDLNRERQEYNNLVVDLQKYREEKQAIEQSKARQLEQEPNIVEVIQQTNETQSDRFFIPQEDSSAKATQLELIEKFRKEFEKNQEAKKVEEQSQVEQKAPQFNTSEERTQLQEAQKILKAEPSLENIQERYKQIDKWEIRVNNGDQYNNWKDQSIKEAANHFQAISSYKNTIQEQQQRLDSINWLNPLKMKENRSIKEQAEDTILASEQKIDMSEKKLEYHREKLGFTTEMEFKKVQVKHEMEKPELHEKNRNQRLQINRERDTLKNAEKAIKQGVIREVASKYPERPEMRYISYEMASGLKESNKQAGRVISVEEIQKARDRNHSKIQEFNKELRFVETESERLKRTEGFLKEADKYQAIVEKYENNPILKGKLLFSKSAKLEYEDAISKRDYYKNELKEQGVSGKDDWDKQAQSIAKLETQVPFIQSQIQPLRGGLNLFDAMLQGIEQAGREAQNQQRRAERAKGKGKGKSKGHSLEDRERGR